MVGAIENVCAGLLWAGGGGGGGGGLLAEPNKSMSSARVDTEYKKKELSAECVCNILNAHMCSTMPDDATRAFPLAFLEAITINSTLALPTMTKILCRW